MSISVVDPFGNMVVISKEIIPDAIADMDLLETIDAPDRVIQHPAILTTTCEGPIECCEGACINHYFRLVGWNNTLLISARKEKEEWVAYNCIHNPSTHQLSAIFNNTRLLL